MPGGSPKDLSDNRKNRTVGHANLVSHVQLYVDRKCEVDLDHDRRIRFHHGSNKRAIRSKILEKEVSRTSKGRKRSMIGLRSLQKLPNKFFALEKGKFKAPPPMTTPVEKQNHVKFCEFHSEVGYNTDECIHLKKQIEEMLKAGKLPHIIKELKQNSGKEQPKVAKKGETSGKDNKHSNIHHGTTLGKRMEAKDHTRFSFHLKFLFPPPGEDEGTEGPMIIEAEIGGHCIHRMYVDGGSASEILYEHCFIRLRPEIKNQLALASPLLIGILALNGNAEDPVARCDTHSRRSTSTEGNPPATKQVVEERVKVAINLEYPEQTVMISSTLIEEGRNKLCGLIQHNLDIFDWKPADMTDAPRHIAEHRLNVREGCSPVRQKKRGQAVDRNRAIQEEVGKLMEAGIMK
ncbi:hypothetical protein Tco_0151408 [Tanacetum coccineum]